MPEAAPRLIELARKRFVSPPLSVAEEKVFRAAEIGEIASSITRDKLKDDPATAASWGTDRTIRAECIVWLCADREALGRTTHRGIKIHGMRIDGILDLSSANVDFPILFWKCVFSENIVLRDAQLQGLFLLACHTKTIQADRFKVTGALLLRTGFKALGEIRLTGAALGHLDCDGAEFSNPGGVALSADGLSVQGSVFLRSGFEAQGAVRFLGARIAGNFECDSAHFSNPQGIALDADGVSVQGSVFLRDRFKADGGVKLLGATIARTLDCSNGEFLNPNGTALNVERATIDGAIFLRNGFAAEGEVNLVEAAIAGTVDCDGAQFSNPKGKALNAERAKIGGAVFLRNRFTAHGQISLAGSTIGGGLQVHGVFEPQRTSLDLRWATVGTLWDDQASWPPLGKLLLDGFRYERFHEKAPLDSMSRIDWLHRQPPENFLPQPYEHLAGVLRQMGHEREARSIVVEKNRARGKFAHFPHADWLWYKLFGRAIGYGYRPLRALAMSVLIILIGTIVFRSRFSQGLISPTRESAYPTQPKGLVDSKRGRAADDYPVFNSFAYSLESFTPFLKLDQSANWQPNANRGARLSVFWVPTTVGAVLRYYLWLHIITGWILTTLWVGAVTGLAKT